MEREESNTISSNNEQFVNQSFIDLRLNTRDMVKDFENFLSAKRSFVEVGEDGRYREIERVIGKPLANQEGITALLNMILLRAHHHAIQGNFDRDHYWENLCKTRKEISKHIIMNCYQWGIEDNKLNYIIDTMLDYLEKVISRLIDNEERKSYIQQFVSKESIVQDQGRKQGALSSFAGGIRGGT
jgi:hypothetical protein|tara:strand:- start:521 stop:1075 length:555 start_codon:yes stop_codon:yes gene_type:complete